MAQSRSLRKLRFKSIWIGLFLVTTFLVFGGSEPWSFFRFLDRYWLATKQHFQRESSSGFKPSRKISLLHLEYSYRGDFWEDNSARQKLAKGLANFKGVTILNLDPLLIQKDPILSIVIQNPRVLHNVRIDRAEISSITNEYLSLEENAGRHVEQNSNSKFLNPQMIKPAGRSYLEAPYLFGSLNFKKDDSSHFIADFPLSYEAAKFRIPSIILPAIAGYYGCRNYRKTLGGRLSLDQCEDEKSAQVHLQLPDPLPLYFYNTSFKRVEIDQLPTAANEILIVDVTDATTYFSTFTGDRTHWGLLAATALSNSIENHIPARPLWLSWLEKFGFYLLLAMVLFASSALFPLRGVLTASIFVIVGVVLFDFLLTYFWNLRTEPVQEFFSLLAFAIIAVATRSIIDMEERGLVERALSGYTSEVRLKRLLSGKEKLSLEGRKDELTILLLDIAGFSKVIAPLGIEEVFTFMQKFFSVVDPIIFQFGGTIDKKTGDGLLAFFGDGSNDSPTEAAKHAVAAAVQIQKLLERELVRAPNGNNAPFFKVAEAVRTRIGVNTGEVMVGNTGSSKHFNYTVLGDAVNFSQRLEAACPLGSVLIGTKTAEYVAADHSLEEIRIAVKNEPEGAVAYRVL